MALYNKNGVVNKRCWCTTFCFWVSSKMWTVGNVNLHCDMNFRTRGVMNLHKEWSELLSNIVYRCMVVRNVGLWNGCIAVIVQEWWRTPQPHTRHIQLYIQHE